MLRTLSVGLSFFLLSCASGPGGNQGPAQRAVGAMGGADRLAGIKTLALKGTFKQWEPEQSDVPGGEPRFANESNFELVQDRALRATRTDFERKYSYPAPRTYKYSEVVTPDAGYLLGVDSTARNAQNQKMTPPGNAMSSLRLAGTQREMRRNAVSSLLLDMSRNPDRVKPAPDINGQPAVSYDAGNGMQYVVAFDPASGLPSRIRTQDYDYVWGDVNYDLVLAQWKDVDGVKIAMNRKYELNGRVISETNYTDVRINEPVDGAKFEVPAALREGAAKPATGKVPYQWVLRRPIIGTYLDSENISFDAAATQSLRMQELAPGVQQVLGGSHNNLVVEMADHLIVFDAPVSDAQSKWVIEQAKAKYPGKPIRYVVLTHHHMDHTGGVRAFLLQGATLVVGQGAGDHWRKVLQSRFTRNPDLAERDLSAVQIMEVADKRAFTDGKREVDVINIENPHAKAYLIGYVADARIGWVTDLWSPGRDQLPEKITPPLASVVNGVKRAGIQPARFAGGHGTSGDYAPLEKLGNQ